MVYNINMGTDDIKVTAKEILTATVIFYFRRAAYRLIENERNIARYKWKSFGSKE